MPGEKDGLPVACSGVACVSSGFSFFGRTDEPLPVRVRTDGTNVSKRLDNECASHYRKRTVRNRPQTFKHYGKGGRMSPRSDQDAKHWVQQAITFYKASGKRIALAEFTNPTGMFVQDELYIYALNPKGTMLAHGVNEKFVGEEFLDLKDSDERPSSRRLSTGRTPTAADGWNTNGITRSPRNGFPNSVFRKSRRLDHLQCRIQARCVSDPTSSFSVLAPIPTLAVPIPVTHFLPSREFFSIFVY